MGKYRKQFMQEMEKLLPGLLDHIEEIWENIGVSPDECQHRTENLIQRAKSMITKTVDMYDEELDKLVNNIEHVGKQIVALASELGMEAKDPDEHLSVLQLEEFLLNYLEELRAIKIKRLDDFEELRLEEKQLAARLDWPHHVLDVDGVPSETQLNELRAHIGELRNEKERRWCIFIALKGSINSLFKTLELRPMTKFECDVLNAGNDFPLTDSCLDDMKALKEKLDADLKLKITEAEKLRERLIVLWNLLNLPLEEKEMFLANNMGHTNNVIVALKEKIKKMEKERMENMHSLICSLREEISVYWDKCLYSSDQKEKFVQFCSDDYTEEVLEAHENYLKDLKELHFDCHIVFAKVVKLRGLFQKLLDFVTKKDLNPERFNNRGGGLLKEEKDRKALQVQIPKLEAEIQDAVRTWESQHSVRLTVFGQSLPDYLQGQWDAYNYEKEKERLERQMKKTRNLEEISKGVGTPQLGKRARVPTGSPLPVRGNKMLKITTPIPSHLTPKNRVFTASILNQVPKTCDVLLKKPPQSSSKKALTTRKTEPRRLLHKKMLSTKKGIENTMPDQPAFNPVELRDSSTAQLLGTSALSTYAEFENKLSSKCLADVNSRSSTVTPCSPVPGSPRRCRSRLGLPMLI